METRLVTDTQTRRTYETRIGRLGEDLSHLKADLSALKQDFQRESIISRGDDDGFLPTEEDGQKAGDQMLGQAGRIQDKNFGESGGGWWRSPDLSGTDTGKPGTYAGALAGYRIQVNPRALTLLVLLIESRNTKAAS